MATKLRMIGNSFLKDYLRGREYNIVLNIGCRKDNDKEGMYYSDYFNSKKVIKIEPSPIDPKKVDYIAKCESLPLESSSSDLVFLHNVFLPFECDIDIVKSVEEVYRVLNDNGEVIISYCDFSKEARSNIRAIRDKILKHFDIIKIYKYKTNGDRYCDKIVDWRAEIFCGRRKLGRGSDDIR